jgi:hypothetical protein
MISDTDLRWLNIEHPCHCGSGGHPRECSRHPFGKRLHVAELNAENNLDACEEAERELAEAQAEIARLKADQWERPGRTWRGACDAMAAELAQLRFDNAALRANLASDEVCPRNRWPSRLRAGVMRVTWRRI